MIRLPPRRFGLWPVLALTACALALAACANVYGDQNQAIVEHDELSFGSAQRLAAEHCAQFDKQSVFVRSDYNIMVLSRFDCVAPD